MRDLLPTAVLSFDYSNKRQSTAVLRFDYSITVLIGNGITDPSRFSYFVEVADDLVEEPEALETLLVDVVLVVELLVVGDLGEHDGNVLVAFTVQLLPEDRTITRLVHNRHAAVIGLL